MDYDRASYQLPVLGTAAAVAMDGAHYTPWIDTNAYGMNALTFIANISAAVAYSAIVWDIEESDDGVSGANVAAAEVVNPLPSDLTKTSKVFHAGTIAKKRYVRAAFTSGGAETGQITVLLDHPVSAPVLSA